MSESIALVGGNEFIDGCKKMDSAILESTNKKRPSVLIVPTAATRQNPHKAASNGVSYFSSLGANASALMIINSRDANNKDLLKPTETSDVIYLTGGDPIFLLDTLSESEFLHKINSALKNGTLIAGSSAGAMVMGQWMLYKNWRKALGITSSITLPHHNLSNPALKARELVATAPKASPILGIDEMTCCLLSNKRWRVLGSGQVTVYGN